MDTAVLSTLSALSGTVIGAISSLGTTWMTTKAQARAARIAAERAKREELYGRYMDELAKVFSNALKSSGMDYDQTIGLFALSGRISLYSSQNVADSAAAALKFVVDLALAPAHSAEQTRELMDRPEADVIGNFARACRAELAALA